MYAYYGANINTDLLRRNMNEFALATHDTKAGVDKSEDDVLLDILADSADMFFNQS